MKLRSRVRFPAALAAAIWLGWAAAAGASTYVVYLPLDSPIYDELDTLNSMGLLDTYLSGIRPISRIEAARLALEAEDNLARSEQVRGLARSILNSLSSELHEEIAWLDKDTEDDQPSMIHPLERLEAQYVYSTGTRRRMVNNSPGALVVGEEATPLVANNDDLPTSSGSNEVLRWSAWGGLGGFLTGYGEASLAGPLTHSPVDANPLTGEVQTTDRLRLLRGEVVGSFGDAALSFGYQEMAWGVGHYASLSQGDNARPFPAFRIQNIHPAYLPSFLRYLGPFRVQAFLGQLDHGRTFSRPWLSGQVITFKPLPTFEIGFDHAIMFGGRGNSNYSALGFVGRASGLYTGSAIVSNTNSRGGIFMRFYFPRARNLQLYQEIVGEDNLTGEIRLVGRFLPFLAVSYQGGAYLPRLTADGRTTARLEYAILEPNYSVHSDSLYWTYKNRFMGDPMGPNASRLDLAFGRWLDDRYKGEADLFYTERAARFGVPGLHKEHSGGIAFDLLSLPAQFGHADWAMASFKTRVALEYVTDINYSDTNAVRIGVVMSGAITPMMKSLGWR